MQNFKSYQNTGSDVKEIHIFDLWAFTSPDISGVLNGCTIGYVRLKVL